MRLILLSVAIVVSVPTFSSIKYPITKKITQIEHRFGVEIKDDYKWMENKSDSDLWNWVEEQQTLTDSTVPQALVKEYYNILKKYQEIEKKNIIAENNLEMSSSNTLHNITNTLALNIPMDPLLKEEKSNVSNLPLERKYYIETESIFGGDLARVTIFRTADKSLADVLVVKFSKTLGIIGDRFIYSSDLDDRLGGSRSTIFDHRIGSNQADDRILYQASSPYHGIEVINQSSYLLLVNEIDYYDLSERLVVFDMRNQSSLFQLPLEGNKIGNYNSSILLRSFEKNNNGEILAYNFNSNKTSVFLEAQDFIVEMIIQLFEDKLLVIGQEDAVNTAFIYHYDSKNLEKIDLPQGGSIGIEGFDTVVKSDEIDSAVIKLKYQNYSQPPKVYEYDVISKALSEKFTHSYPIKVETEKLYYTAPNGQKAAIHLFYKEGSELSEDTPTLIYGYGGFNANMMPRFNSVASLAWLEKGGSFAVVTLPGSLVYGKSWNDLAKKGKRINSFDSFAAAGQLLIDKGYTSSEKLGMLGGSNGGLLVAGTLQRHPELFAAATPMVGVLDLYNYRIFGAGKYWGWEYGNPFIEEDFLEVKDISPYHNINKINYPAVMVMTAEFDDRVDIMHSFKYAAKLQENQQGNAPILLYTKEWGGHSSRSGSQRQSLGYQAYMFSFFDMILGLSEI